MASLSGNLSENYAPVPAVVPVVAGFPNKAEHLGSSAWLSDLPKRT